MNLRDLIFHAEYQLHRERGLTPSAAFTIATENADSLSSSLATAQELHDLQAAGVSPNVIADLAGLQPSPTRYVVIQARRYPYGPASTFPVSPDGRTGAAIEHGTVSDLVTNAKQRGDRILEIGHEARDQAELAVQTLRLAELYRAAQSGKQDDRSPGVKRFDDTMAGMLIESELRKHLANALAVLDVLAPRPWSYYQPDDASYIVDAQACCACLNAWSEENLERLNAITDASAAQADLALVLRAIDDAACCERPWTVKQVVNEIDYYVGALARHGWTEADLVAVVNSLPRSGPSQPDTEPDNALEFARSVKQLAAQRDENAAKYLALLADFDKLRSAHAELQRERDGLAQAYAVAKLNG